MQQQQQIMKNGKPTQTVEGKKHLANVKSGR